MGGILLKAMLKEGILTPKKTVATVHHVEKAEKLTQERGINVGTDNTKAARDADLVFLCVKPGTVSQVAQEISTVLKPGCLVVSIAASVPCHYIERGIGDTVPVVRAMPNTPCSVGYGMTGICKGKYANESHLEIAETLFSAVGRTIVVDEKHMDAVTGLSASGPAFVYIILESLAEAGVKVGLPRDIATLLVSQTVQGAARVVLETGDHPALLKDQVTTPAGCTIDGILELEEGKLRVTLIKAVVKATERARELLLVN